MAEYPSTAQTLIELLSCAVNETECKLSPEEVDFDELYTLSKAHEVRSAVAFALESAGIADRRFTQAKLKAKRKLGLFDIEREKICEKLSDAGIWYLPLKGIVMKEFYPRYGMREMSDNDILCDSTKMPQVREIMESLGYTCESYGEWNHDVYQKPPTLDFEMHHSLFKESDAPLLGKYYENVFDRLTHKGGCEYAFTDEDFYIYMLAHTYKHFSNSGTGLRPLLDIYVYLTTHPELDLVYIAREVEILRLTEFERITRDLARKLFDKEKLSEEDRELLPLFLDSSLYGTVEQQKYNRLTRLLDGRDTKRSKTRYFFNRVFLNGDQLEKHYPFFAKNKWLLPILYLYRPFKGLFRRPKEIMRETKDIVRYRSPKRKL